MQVLHSLANQKLTVQHLVQHLQHLGGWEGMGRPGGLEKAENGELATTEGGAVTESNTAISYEVLLDRVTALLKEWGGWQHKGGTPFVRGYPSESIESRMMRDWGRRTKGDKRRREFQRRVRRKVEMRDQRGRVVRLLSAVPMYPDRADKQSSGHRPPDAEWPDHIRNLDRLIAELPRPMVSVARTYYVAGMPIRIGAQTLRISKAEYEKRLNALHWYVVGEIKRIDIGLSGQKDAS